MADDTRLIELLVQWEELHNQGTDVSPEELASDCPELATELMRRISDLQKMDRLLDTPQRQSERSPGGVGQGFPHVSGYEILQELGRGGMGVVYKARQLGLRRLVALKMILAGRHAQPEDLARFRVEAEAVARLQHPHIVQIHEIGEQDGLPYFSLEFVSGGSLAQKLTGAPLQAAPSAALVEILARAIQHAHEQGIIHRDLKPANILLSVVSGPSSVVEEGRGSPLQLTTDNWQLTTLPKITDFGLAKRLDEEVGRTQTGAVMGTPSYMAPEQAQGRTQEIGPLTDVHALGAILYELLTGRPPFRGADVLDTLEQVRSQEPVPPRRLQPKVPRDLETICLKCLEKEPRKRYASARELAEDLRRFQAGEPIVARPASWYERASKWARRRPAIAALLAAVALTTALGFAGVTWQWLRAETALEATELARREEEKQKQEATAAQEKATALAETEAAAKKDARERLAEALTSLYFERIARADREWWAKDVAVADQILEDCQPPEMRGWEWHYLKHQCHADRLTFRGHRYTVTSVAYSPDGQRLVSADVEGIVRVWNAATGEVVFSLQEHEAGVMCAVFSKDGRWLATAGVDKTVRVWDAATGKETQVLRGHGAMVQSVAFRPDGQQLASCGQDGTIRIWDAVEGKEALILRKHGPTVSGVAYSPDGQRLASAGGKGTVKVWNAGTGEEIFSFTHSGAALSIAYSPDGKQLASGSTNHLIKVWDAVTGQELRVFRGHSEWVKAVAFSPDSKRLASASYDQTVMVWDALAGRELFTLRGHTRNVHGVAFSPDGKHLASASSDGTVKTWNAAAPEALTLSGGKFSVFGVAFSPDGKHLASAGGDKTVRILDSASGETVHLFRTPASAFFSVAYRPDGQQVAGVGADGILRLWNTTTGQEEKAVLAHSGRARSVTYTPDGQCLISAGADKRVVIWDARTGKEILTLEGHPAVQRCVVVCSPNGQLLASAGEDQIVRLREVATGREVLALREQGKIVHAVAFSSCSQRLASASIRSTEDRKSVPEIRIWNVADGKELLVLRGHTQMVDGLAFSPDGRRLASASWDRTVRIWDVATGRHVMTLRGHPSEVLGVAWSRDSGRLASAGSDGTVRVWDGTPAENCDLPH